MKDWLIEKAAEYLIRNHRRQRWKRLVSVLAAVVVFVTTYALILPAITLESDSITEGDYMYPVSDERGEEYEIPDSGGEPDGEAPAEPEGNALEEAEEPEEIPTEAEEAETEIPTEAEETETASLAEEETAFFEEPPETETAISEEATEPETVISETPAEDEATSPAEPKEPEEPPEEPTEENTVTEIGEEPTAAPTEAGTEGTEKSTAPSVTLSGVFDEILIEDELMSVICWTADITPDGNTAYFLDTLNLSDGDMHTYATGTDITVTIYRKDGTEEEIICGLPGSGYEFSAEEYSGNDFYIDLKSICDAENSPGDFVSCRIVYYTAYTENDDGGGLYLNTAQLLTDAALSDGISEETVLAQGEGRCDISQALISAENGIMLAALSDDWQIVTDADGVEQMALVMYYCNYNSADKTVGIGGYERHQLVPGKISGYETAEGTPINKNSYRFEITGAYTNGTDYLIPVEYFESAYGNKQYKYGYCDYVFNPNVLCPFIYASGSTWSGGGGSNSYRASIMCAATYYNYNGNYYVRITAADIADQPYKIGVVYYTALEKATDTYNPNSTVINLFDYWSTPERKDSDNHPSSDVELNSGINENHALKFGKSMNGYGLMNHSYGGTATPSKRTQGIISNRLGNDRYPYLSGSLTTSDGEDLMPPDTTEEQSVESLAYLFDPNISAEGKKSFPNVTGLLWQDGEGYYCYDSSLRAGELDEDTCVITEYTSPAGVYTPSGVSGQFFPFNDAHRTTLTEADKDPINHYFGLTLTSRFIQQFGGKKTMTSNEDVIFHFIGDNDVWIFIDNVLVADLGGLGSAAEVTINFHTGEVLIDDSFNAEVPTGTKSTTIREAFIAANPNYENLISWNGDTFPDETLHTLKFYYLERGNFDSNLKLQYNLNQVPVSKIEKVDQYGRYVDNARLAIYRADESYNYIGDNGGIYTSADLANFTVDEESGEILNGSATVITPAFVGVTENGEMPLLSGDDMPYSMEELESLLGSKMILREIKVPDGFRTVSDEVYLTIQGGVMFCDNTYTSGVLANANVLINATNQLYVAREYGSVAQSLHENNGEIWTVGEREVQDNPSGATVTVPIYSVNYYDVANNQKNGTLFSVVLKRNGRDFWHGYGYDYWYPVYGSDKKGYTVVESVPGVENAVPIEPQNEAEWSTITYDTAPTNIEAVIYAAKAQANLLGESALTFQESGNGMQLLMEHLPGKINRYYTFMLNNSLLDASNPSDTDPQYVVAYYWTSADSVAGATADNTVRVYSHENLVSDVEALKLQWSTTISVPNLENRLFFQKTNEQGELIDDAVFALYEVFDAAPTKEGVSYGYNFIYYIGSDESGNKVYVAPLDNAVSNPQPGRAVVFGVNNDESVYVIGYGDYTINSAAAIRSDEETGAYTGLSGTNIGRITVVLDAPSENADGAPVKPIGSLYYVDPAKSADGSALIGATHNVCAAVNEEGTGHFDRLKEGRYYLREISAPSGYTLNKDEVPVLVNKNGVYANAGTEDNGVSVGNGIGYLTSTLDAYASHGDIDETMTWVYGALIQNDAEDFSAFDKISGDVIHVEDGTSKDKWHFVKPNPARDDGYGSGVTISRGEAMVTYLEYADILAEDSGKEVVFDYTPNDNQSARERAGEEGAATLEGEGMIRLFTDEGWSDLAVYQDYAYGYSRATTGRTTNYTDLTDYGNISNLFSSSTFVRVTDRPRVDAAVRKVSAEDGTALSGAEFRLYYTDKSGIKHYYKTDEYGAATWTINEVTFVTDADVPVKFTDLPDGTYYLEEVSAPVGYQILSGPIELIIADGKLALGASLPGGVSSDSGAVQTSGEILYTVTVPNSIGSPLPETGGCGTIYIYILGSLLTAAALWGFLHKRRRE